VASHDPGVVEGWCDESLSLAAGAIVVHRAGSHVASPPEVSRAGEVAGAV
jgi:ABC-type glutathione transport system ATPase component